MLVDVHWLVTCACTTRRPIYSGSLTAVITRGRRVLTAPGTEGEGDTSAPAGGQGSSGVDIDILRLLGRLQNIGTNIGTVKSQFKLPLLQESHFRKCVPTILIIKVMLDCGRTNHASRDGVGLLATVTRFRPNPIVWPVRRVMQRKDCLIRPDKDDALKSSYFELFAKCLSCKHLVSLVLVFCRTELASNES